MEVLGGGSLQISNLTEEDAGVYTCVAENSNGTIEAQAQLTVQGMFVTFPLSALRQHEFYHHHPIMLAHQHVYGCIGSFIVWGKLESADSSALMKAQDGN